MEQFITPSERKETFLQGNEMFAELELSDSSKAIGDIDVDLLENDIWLLQCPKGMDIKKLEKQKLKMPGRTNLDVSEAVSMEFNDGNEQHAFAYFNSNGDYALRLLPVSGTIVLRDRLKAVETVTPQRIEECCPPAKRVPMPSNLRVRHPLLGFQYEDKLILDKNVAKRLKRADKVSAQILKDNLVKKMEAVQSLRESSSVNYKEYLGVDINSAEGEEKKKRKKSKHNNNESSSNDTDIKDKSLKKKIKKEKNDEIVSEDLQWIQNI